MSVYDLANRLARRIKESDQYKEYIEQREKVIKNEKTKEMLLDFQEEQYKLQAKQLSGDDLTAEEKDKLENLRELIELNKDIKLYLQAEYKINRMLNDVQKNVFGDLDLGIPQEEKNENNSEISK
ncbi:MAG: YlbF family regulator [Halanaerobiales bacterium]|nr:YlbF family regulator [Halanaerobiales bacterium]